MFNYDNIGGKIKTLAKVSFIVFTVLGIFYGLYLLFEFASALGFFVLFLAPFLSWISSWLLYGFGQLIENSDYMVSIKQKEQQDHTEENE